MARIVDSMVHLVRLSVSGCVILLALFRSAHAGPPYFSDDPEPTDYGHYEVYSYTNGTTARDASVGEAGIDFNYGAAPDLQLTLVVPVAYAIPAHDDATTGLGNVEIAVKYRILHQSDTGWDVAIFPQLFLPSGSSAVGERNVSLLLPIWLGRNWDKWSTFGGGGCVINQGGKSQDFCLAGWALTCQILPNLQLGFEVYHQTADTKGGHATSGLGSGLIYDLNEHLHLLASAGPGIQNAAETDRMSWYFAILFTY